MFPCLNELILITQDHPSFLNAIMVITDYFKTYGEQIFQIISRERRVAIDCHYEVKISPTQLYFFLSQKQIQNLQNYFVEQFKNKWLAYSDEKFKKLKEYQVEVLEKSRKAAEEDQNIEEIENTY